MYTYIEAIGAGFPTVQAHTAGELYTDLVWDAGDPLPSQATLDSWILSNAPSTSRKITVLAFRNRFTQAEKVAIDLSSIDDPAATMPARQLAASLRVMASDLTVATFVDLDRSDTRAGVQITRNLWDHWSRASIRNTRYSAHYIRIVSIPINTI